MQEADEQSEGKRRVRARAGRGELERWGGERSGEERSFGLFS